MYTNPVIDDNFPDPTIIRAADGWYYAYGTQTKRAGVIINLQVARSADLVSWEYLGEGLPAKARLGHRQPENLGPARERARRALLPLLLGPARRQPTTSAWPWPWPMRPPARLCDSGRPLLAGPGFTCIDPMAFDDPATGQRLLYWGSGFGPIWVRELADDRLGFAPGSVAAGRWCTPAVSDDPADYHRLMEGGLGALPRRLVLPVFFGR